MGLPGLLADKANESGGDLLKDGCLPRSTRSREQDWTLQRRIVRGVAADLKYDRLIRPQKGARDPRNSTWGDLIEDRVTMMPIDREPMQIPILALGKGWLVVDKPVGMTVHNEAGRGLCSLAFTLIQKETTIRGR